MASAWPGVVGYLIGALPSLSGWEQVQVFDGPPNTGDDPADYVTVGYVADDDDAGGFTQEQLDDFSVTETGTVRLDLTAQTGDDTLSPVRGRVFAMFDALDLHLRHNQTLGGALSANGTVVLAADGVRSTSNERGVAQTVICTVSYATQTYL